MRAGIDPALIILKKIICDVIFRLHKIYLWRESMIKKYDNYKLNNCETLLDALELNGEKNPIISFVGAGGKTTTMKRIAMEYINKGIPVIVTTTTHLYNEKEPWFLLEPSKEKALKLLKQYKMVWLGKVTKNGKMGMPDKEFLDEMISLGYPVLIEADGARRLPCKAPGENEPVYIEETSCIVGVYGIDSIGKKIEEICFRPELVSNIINKDLKDFIEEKDIAILATDKRAGMKNIEDRKYKVVINKVDNINQEKQAEKICKYVWDNGMYDIIVTGK